MSFCTLWDLAFARLDQSPEIVKGAGMAQAGLIVGIFKPGRTCPALTQTKCGSQTLADMLTLLTWPVPMIASCHVGQVCLTSSLTIISAKFRALATDPTRVTQTIRELGLPVAIVVLSGLRFASDLVFGSHLST